MQYLRDGFRTLYHHFVIFPINELFKEKLEYFPESRYANAVICYGYMDPVQGMKAAVLGAGFFKDSGVQIGRSNNDIEFSIPVKELVNYDYYMLDDDPILKKEYAYKLEQLSRYSSIPEIERMRSLDFLDELRDPFDIDRIQVVFEKEGYDTERLWCKLMGQNEHNLVAVALENANAIPEILDGKMIEFYMENRDGKETAVCNVDLLRHYSQEQLRDGSILKEAIHRYNKHPDNGSYFLEVLEIIRESHFYVGGYYYLDEFNQRKFQLEVLDHYNDVLPIYSDEFEANHCIHEDIFEMDLLEIIELVENHDTRINRIIINLEKEPFMIEEEVWIALKEMISLNQNIN